MWKDSDETGDIKSLNFNESSLPMKVPAPCPVVVASPTLSEQINPALPENFVMASSEAFAVQDNPDIPRVRYNV